MFKSFSSAPARLAASQALPTRFQLEAGHALYQGDQRHVLWRVMSGVLRLDQTHHDGRVLVTLARAGDLVGFETLCGGTCPFDVSALTDAELVPLTPVDAAQRQVWLIEALLQQPQRSHDMARLRTGPIASRLSELLCLLGHVPTPDVARHLHALNADAVRHSLPSLRDLAEVVDAKPETVCRALAQLLPPRTRKSGPRRWTETAGNAAAVALGRLSGGPGRGALT